MVRVAELSEIARKVASRHLEAGKARVDDFLPGQEMQDDFDPDFGTFVDTEFLITADEAAKALGFQRRVYEDRVRKMSTHKLIAAFGRGKGYKLLQTIWKQEGQRDAAKFIGTWTLEEFGRDIRITGVDIDKITTVEIQPDGGLKIWAEVGILGRWLDSERGRHATDEWTYHNVTIEEGVDGSGKKQFVVQGEKRAKGKRTQHVNEKFDTFKEAENWVKHAMPGAKVKKAAGP